MPKAPKSPKKVKKRDRSASEESLIQAGLEIFSECGFDGATTRRISERAGINESLINRYFEGKRGLLEAVAAAFKKKREEEKLDYPPGATLEEELRGYCCHIVRAMDRDACYFRIVFSQALVDPEFQASFRQLVRLEGDPRVLERLQALQERRRIDPALDLNEVLFLFGAQVFSMAFLARVVLGFDQKVLTAQLEKMAATYLQGLATVTRARAKSRK